jgi:hypothetical protein
MPAYSYIWQFQVAADRVADFETHYSPGGSWTRLFSRARGYVGTVLLRDRVDPLRYVTIDTWESIEAYARFLKDFGPEYRDLDEVCAGLTTSEAPLGEFSGVGDTGEHSQARS